MLALILVFVIGVGYRIESFGSEIVTSAKGSPALPFEFILIGQKSNEDKGWTAISAVVRNGERGKFIPFLKTGQHFSRINMNHGAGFSTFKCVTGIGACSIRWDRWQIFPKFGKPNIGAHFNNFRLRISYVGDDKLNAEGIGVSFPYGFFDRNPAHNKPWSMAGNEFVSS